MKFPLSKIICNGMTHYHTNNHAFIINWGIFTRICPTITRTRWSKMAKIAKNNGNQWRLNNISERSKIIKFGTSMLSNKTSELTGSKILDAFSHFWLIQCGELCSFLIAAMGIALVRREV